MSDNLRSIPRTYGDNVIDYSLEDQIAAKNDRGRRFHVVADLTKHIKDLDNRLHGSELVISQRDDRNQLVFPSGIEMGSWIDDDEMQQKGIQRLLDEGSIPPVEPLR